MTKLAMLLHLQLRGCGIQDPAVNKGKTANSYSTYLG